MQSISKHRDFLCKSTYTQNSLNGCIINFSVYFLRKEHGKQKEFVWAFLVIGRYPANLCLPTALLMSCKCINNKIRIKRPIWRGFNNRDNEESRNHHCQLLLLWDVCLPFGNYQSGKTVSISKLLLLPLPFIIIIIIFIIIISRHIYRCSCSLYGAALSLNC